MAQIKRRLLIIFWVCLLGTTSMSQTLGQSVGQTNASSTDSSTEPATTAASAGKVGTASLTGPIDRLSHRYLDRIVDRARELELDTLVLHIDTDGGEVGHAREMFKRVVDQAKDGPRMIAFVDFRAISAGAMISYAHEEIYISKGASIGDIGVIFVSREGEIKYAPEKIETVIRSLLTQAADLRGWDRGLLLKMTARSQKLYYVTLPEGEKRYVIEDDLPQLLSLHPELDPENRAHMYVYRGEDRLLTLTGQEAVRLGMATGHAETLEEVYAAIGAESDDVIEITPTISEEAAWALAPFAPILAGLALLFIMFELKTPGVGLWAIAAGTCAAGFLLTQYYLDLAENFEVILIVSGILLLGVDVLLGLGAGAFALAGGLAILTGLLLSFIPNEVPVDFTDPQFIDAVKQAAFSTLWSVGVIGIGMIVLVRILPRSSAGQRLAVAAEITATAASDANSDLSVLANSRGVTREAMRPSGIVEIDGRDYSARVQHGSYLEPDTPIRVVRIEFGELIVEAT